MFQLIPDVTQDWIEERVSAEEIFSYYLDIPVTLGNLICSPLRVDMNPTCRFYYSKKDKLLFKDFSGHFWGDCYDVVQLINSCSFQEALQIIATDFKLLDVTREVKIIKKEEREVKTKNRKKTINYEIREWTEDDLKYWSKYYITQELLSYFQVYPVKRIWVDSSLCYSNNKLDLAYVYVFNQEEFKIYFPCREKKKMRFMCEATCLQGYNKIPKEGNNLIITKSYKDVMTLYNFGIAAVAPQAESQIINEEQYIDFSKRFKNVYSMYDFDLTGIRSANKMRKLYNIQPLFLTNGRFNSFNYGSKDPSDFVEKEGPQEFIKTINRFKNFKP